MGIVLCAFLLVDYATGQSWPPRNSQWVLYILIGVCVGQVNLIATWAALAPGNFVVRLPWSLLLAVFMWYSLVLGSRAGSPGFSLDDAVVLGIVLLSAVVVVQIPLWIAARLFGWRLASWAGEVRDTSPGRLQFHLGHLLLGMLFVSIALAPGRAVLPPGDLRDLELDEEVLALIPVAIGCNLVIAVPCIWGAFLSRRILVPLAFGWVVYCAILTAVEYGTLVALLGPPGKDETPLLMYLGNLSQCSAVFGTLLVFRALGFRLLRVPSRRRRKREKDRTTASSDNREEWVRSDGMNKINGMIL